MNTSRFPTTLALVGAMATSTVLFAAPAFMKLGDIKGECNQSEQALLEIRATQPQPVMLLLPAVQKVREAASRMQAACKGVRDLDACNAQKLSTMLLESDDGRDPALSLLDLYARSSGQSLKDAKLSVRKAGGSGDASAAKGLLDGILIGLLKEMRAAGMPASVSAPIKAALEAAPEAAPARMLAPETKPGG